MTISVFAALHPFSIAIHVLSTPNTSYIVLGTNETIKFLYDGQLLASIAILFSNV